MRHQDSLARSSQHRCRNIVAMVYALVVGCLCLPSCAFRFLADYDEVVVAKTVELQEKAETLFLALEEAATTEDPLDDLYAAHAGDYDRILVLLRVLEVRAATLTKNELTVEQVALLRDSFEKMKAQHKERSAATPPKGFSAATIRVLREPFVQQIQSILTLQSALRR